MIASMTSSLNIEQPLTSGIADTLSMLQPASPCLRSRTFSCRDRRSLGISPGARHRLHPEPAQPCHCRGGAQLSLQAPPRHLAVVEKHCFGDRLSGRLHGDPVATRVIPGSQLFALVGPPNNGG